MKLLIMKFFAISSLLGPNVLSTLLMVYTQISQICIDCKYKFVKIRRCTLTYKRVVRIKMN
jgi:hypothetical protein